MSLARKLTSSFLIALLTVGLSSCGSDDSHEAILPEMVDLMDEVATIVQSADDKTSAEAAAKKIDAITAKFEMLSKRAKSLGDPPKNLLTTFADQNSSKIEATIQNLGAAIIKLNNTPDTSAAAAALARFQKAFSTGGLMGAQ